MSLEELAAHTTPERPSASTNDIFIAPPLLPVCCICGLIRDETGPCSDVGRWVTHRTYRKTHGVNPSDFPLTHTYCPECFTQVQDSVRKYFREIGTSR